MSRRTKRKGRRVASALLGLALVVSLFAAGVGAQTAVGGEPDLEVFVQDPVLTPGSSSTLTLQVANDAEANFGSIQERSRVTAARNVRVDVDADGTPIGVESGRYSIGTVTENEPRNAPIAVDIPEDADPGYYELDVELEYSYTSGLFPKGEVEYERTKTVTRTVEVEIDDSPRFELTGVNGTAVQVGEAGAVEIDVENIGAESASDIAVGVESQSSVLSFGRMERDTARIDSLAPGEVETVVYEISIAPDSPVREYDLDGTVRYTDPNGIRGHDGELSVGIQSIPEQTFSMTAEGTGLHADEEGTVAVTITNDGPVTAHDISIDLAREYPNVRLLEDAVSAGTLESGESVTVGVPFDLSRDADPVSKTLDVNVGYRTADGEHRVDPDHSLVIDIRERRDDFVVTVSDSTITVDSSRLIEVEVTNNRDQRLTDVEAKLGTSDPLNSNDDEGYVEALEPGESTTMTFELSTTGDANPKAYSIAMDFRYDDEKGKTKMSNVYRIPIGVEEGEGTSMWFIAGVVLVITAVVIAYYILRIRNRPRN